MSAGGSRRTWFKSCSRYAIELEIYALQVLSKIQRLNYVCSPCNEEEDTISNQALRISQQIESSQYIDNVSLYASRGPKALLNSIWQNLHAESYARQTYPTLSENQQEIIHTVCVAIEFDCFLVCRGSRKQDQHPESVPGRVRGRPQDHAERSLSYRYHQSLDTKQEQTGGSQDGPV